MPGAGPEAPSEDAERPFLPIGRGAGAPRFAEADGAAPGPGGAAIAPVGEDPTVAGVTYADHAKTTHRVAHLRPVHPGERPGLPISPHLPDPEEGPDLGPAPGTVIRFETRYEGRPPAMRRIDASGRVLWDGLATDLGWGAGLATDLGWGAGLALQVRCGPGHWATFTSAGRQHQPSERRLAHAGQSYLGCHGLEASPHNLGYIWYAPNHVRGGSSAGTPTRRWAATTAPSRSWMTRS